LPEQPNSLIECQTGGLLGGCTASLTLQAAQTLGALTTHAGQVIPPL